MSLFYKETQEYAAEQAPQGNTDIMTNLANRSGSSGLLI